MSRPLQTPSGMSASVPIPRSPDGSPIPQRRASSERAKLKASEPEPYTFSEAEAAEFLEKHPEIANADLSQAVEVEVQTPRGPEAPWVNLDEAEQIKSDMAAAAQVDFSRKHEPGVYTPTDNQVISGTTDGTPLVDVLHGDGTAEKIIAEQKAEEQELTPAQKRAATIAAKKAAKEARDNG